jgi:hypothetical protein
MRDLETESLWSHIMGKCMRGDLIDTELEMLPGVMTTWADWKTKHPSTTVLNLSRTASEYNREIYNYNTGYIFGIRHGSSIKAYTFADLQKTPVINDNLNTSSLLISFDPKSTRAYAFDRQVDGQILTFEASTESGALIDTQTKSSWDPWTGKSTQGKMKGTELKWITGIVSYAKAWETFYPETQVYQQPTE